MCGIAGIIGSNNSFENKSLLYHMLLMQYHRGPDDWGIFEFENILFGHNRLAIIDINSGIQPMTSHCGNYVIVFNGEIYNYNILWKLLLKRGYKFNTSHSDTEVILNGFAEWGINLFNKLEGMFSFALFDKLQNKVFLVRDKIGIKPLFYSLSKKKELFFASELKSILATKKNYRVLNYKVLDLFFLFRSVPGEDTLVEGILKLEPSRYLEYDLKQKTIKIKEYYSLLENYHPYDISLNNIIEKHDYLLKNACASHMLSDVPIGVFLSGGIDSSLVAKYTTQIDPSVNTYNISSSDGIREDKFASEIAKKIESKFFSVIVSPNEFMNYLSMWSYFNDSCIADPSGLVLMQLSEFCRQEGMKVMLSGEGADEIYGGYNSYYKFMMNKIYNLSFFEKIDKFARINYTIINSRNQQFSGTASISSPEQRKKLLVGNSNIYKSSIDYVDFINNEINKYYVSVKDSVLLFDQIVRLPSDLLLRTDSASMAFSLEARVPFLDSKIVEEVNNISNTYKYSLFPKKSKIVLKKISEKYYSKKIIYRKKIGFDLPLATWFRQPVFQEKIMCFLDERKIDQLDYIYLNTLVKNKIPYHGLIWAWISLEEFYRTWIISEPLYKVPKFLDNPIRYESLVKLSQVGK